MSIKTTQVGKESRISHLLFFFVFSLFVFSSFCVYAAAETAQSRKIVVFKKSFDSHSSQDNILKKSGALKIKSLKLINGAAVQLSPQTERELKSKNEVLRIDEDIFIQTSQSQSNNKGKGKGKKNPDQPVQTYPWNMLMIRANLAWPQTTGEAVKVAILDTGIDLNHPDLFKNIKGNINITKPKKSGDDDSGHGTHVAGIVAGVDNAIGVIGVGPGIDLYSVKVLDKQGNGWLSDLIDGLDWCIDNDIQVINMSLGSTQDNLSFHEAVKGVSQAGITQIAAAGNYGYQGGAVSYPGKYPETIAVSSIDEYGNIDPFSSSGAEVNFGAPGVEVRSTYKDGLYARMSGTSMAAPHVTGIVALILTKAPANKFDGNKNGIWDPDEILEKLQRTAYNLGLPVEQQGAGLVLADEAIR